MNRYVVTLKHDRGTIKIATFASSPEAAVRNVLHSEGAPLSAVVRVK